MPMKRKSYWVSLMPSDRAGWRRSTGLLLVLAAGATLVATGRFLVSPAMVDDFVTEREGATWLGAALLLHVLAGGVALAVGGWQWLARPPVRGQERWHRLRGRIYVDAVMVSAAVAILMAGYAPVSLFGQAGLLLLALCWVVTTSRGAKAISHGLQALHRRWMIRSYALTLAAVSLRLQMTVLQAVFGYEVEQIYAIILWTCWVPNLLVAELIIASARGGAVSRSTSPVPD
jgi:uncharacterized membrane protein